MKLSNAALEDIGKLINNCSIINNAIIYCRSSTPNQNSYNHCSLDTQKYNCRRYCNENELKIVNMVTEVCSATKSSNQNKLLEIINTFKNTNLVIYDASRFSRNIVDGVNLLNECMKKNIVIHNVKDDYTTKKHNGFLNFVDGIRNGDAESKLISERIKSSYAYRRSRGADFGVPPFGHKKIKENGIDKFIENEEEIKIIKFAKALYFGCTVKDANNSMKSITNHKITSLFNDSDKKIEYGNFSFTMIAQFFNENNIKNRNKDWKGNSISRIIKNNETIGKRKTPSNHEYDDDEYDQDIYKYLDYFKPLYVEEQINKEI
jgi:DNA invertase Pin-like site-specific DNA recombinase